MTTPHLLGLAVGGNATKRLYTVPVATHRPTAGRDGTLMYALFIGLLFTAAAAAATYAVHSHRKAWKVIRDVRDRAHNQQLPP